MGDSNDGWAPPDPDSRWAAAPPSAEPPAQYAERPAPPGPRPHSAIPGVWLTPTAAMPPPARSRSRSRIAIWVVAALTTLSLLVGTGVAVVLVARRAVGHTTAAQQTHRRRALPGARELGIDNALDRLSRAMQDRDEPAFLATIAPGDAALRERWQKYYTAITALPMTAHWEWRSRESEDPVRPADYPADALVVHAAFVQHLNGWDDLKSGSVAGQVEVEEPQTLTLAPSDTIATDADSWQIVADDQADSPDAAGRPWMVGGVSTAVRPHVLVIGDDQHKAGNEVLAGQVEQALGDVRRLWPEPDWNGKVVVYTMADPGFQSYWFGGAEPDSMVLAKDVPSRIRIPRERGVARLLVSTKFLHEDPAVALNLLRSELTAVAVYPRTTGQVLPDWLTRGSGDYTASRGTGRRISADAALMDRGLTRETITALRGGHWAPDLSDDILQVSDFDTSIDGAWLACLYVGDTYGDAVLRRLLERTADEGADTSTAAEAAGLKAVLHTDRARFSAAVSRYALALFKRHPNVLSTTN